MATDDDETVDEAVPEPDTLEQERELIDDEYEDPPEGFDAVETPEADAQEQRHPVPPAEDAEHVNRR